MDGRESDRHCWHDSDSWILISSFFFNASPFAVNDAFVMREYEKFFPKLKDSKVLLLSDFKCDYTKKLGFEVDLSDLGLGVRSRRFSLVADNLVIKILHLEEGGAFDKSSAEDLLKQL